MEKLKDYTLEIIVMDKDRIGRNECIGKVSSPVARTKKLSFCIDFWSFQILSGYPGAQR